MIIELTPVEMLFAASAATVRRETGMADGMDKNKHAEISDWYTDFIGAQGEISYARWSGQYWGGRNRSFKEPDVGLVQVRATHRLDGHLIIRPNDKKVERYVFVVVSRGRCRIVGWMDSNAAKQDRYWRKDSWWVPQADLTPLERIEQAA
jgi:hypothetical protein